MTVAEKTPRERYQDYWRKGRARGDATSFFVVHDPGIGDSYAVYTLHGDDPEAVRRTYGPPNKVSRFYNLNLPIEPQLDRSDILL